jgi:F-type H+-transporting ATPase subunit a
VEHEIFKEVIQNDDKEGGVILIKCITCYTKTVMMAEYVYCYDYTVVFMLTLVSIVSAQVFAIVANGPIGYLKKYINFSSPLDFVLGLMDIIGELSKILSLSFRLFGNVFAGEVLGSVMLFLMPFFLPLPFMFMGLLSALIQAFVFSLLSTIFITMAWDSPAPESPVLT